MDEPTLRRFAMAILELGFFSGLIGGMVWHLVMSLVADIDAFFQRRSDLVMRVRDARFRARWAAEMRAAKASGLSGRRAVRAVAHAMRVNRHALDQYRQVGRG